MTVTTRPARPEDAAPMAALLNTIIARGGTTAHQAPFDPDRILSHYVLAPDAISCTLAEIDGTIIGFQALGTAPGYLPEGWGEIGTFVAEGMQGKGVGKALFAASSAAARAAGLRHIDATIRADNFGGLAYYTGLGFRDYRILRHVPLADGHPVDRHGKRFDL
jgi:GNAT superfamily N-acetyltransferase